MPHTHRNTFKISHLGCIKWCPARSNKWSNPLGVGMNESYIICTIHQNFSQMKHISVHLQRKSHFPNCSTFLNFRCPKWNVRNVTFTRFKFCSSSPITNVETMCGDFLWYVLINQWHTHRKFLPGSWQNRVRNEGVLCFPLWVTNAFIDFTRGFDSLWFMIPFSSFWRFWWYITGSETQKFQKNVYLLWHRHTLCKLSG